MTKLKKSLIFALIICLLPSLFLFTGCIKDDNTPKTYTISCMENNSSYGNVYGQGTYYEGQFITLVAVANEGYKFERWEHYGYTTVSTSQAFSCTVSGDATYVAFFTETTPEAAPVEYYLNKVQINRISTPFSNSEIANIYLWDLRIEYDDTNIGGFNDTMLFSEDGGIIVFSDEEGSINDYLNKVNAYADRGNEKNNFTNPVNKSFKLRFNIWIEFVDDPTPLGVGSYTDVTIGADGSVSKIIDNETGAVKAIEDTFVLYSNDNYDLEIKVNFEFLTK